MLISKLTQLLFVDEVYTTFIRVPNLHLYWAESPPPDPVPAPLPVQPVMGQALLDARDALLALVQLSHQKSIFLQIFFLLQLLMAFCCSMELFLSQVRIFLLEIHGAFIISFLQSVNFPLNSNPPLQNIDCSHQPGILPKLNGSPLPPIIQIINKTTQ